MTTKTARPLLGSLLLLAIFITALTVTWEGRPQTTGQTIALVILMVLAVVAGLLLSRIPEPQAEDSPMHVLARLGPVLGVLIAVVVQSVAGPRVQFTLVGTLACLLMSFLVSRSRRH